MPQPATPAPVMPYVRAVIMAFTAPPYVHAAAAQPGMVGYAPTVV
jgi:hypothetical protein